MKKGSDGLLHLPIDLGYYVQVQGEMAILGVEWCDFVVYSNGVVVEDRILADADYWKNLEENLEQFYLYYIVPNKTDIFGEIWSKYFVVSHPRFLYSCNEISSVDKWRMRDCFCLYL